MCSIQHELVVFALLFIFILFFKLKCLQAFSIGEKSVKTQGREKVDLLVMSVVSLCCHKMELRGNHVQDRIRGKYMVDKLEMMVLCQNFSTFEEFIFYLQVAGNLCVLSLYLYFYAMKILFFYLN